MFADLMSLDTPLGLKLIRPFHLAGSALAVLLAGMGLLLGLATMVQSALLGLIVVALGVLSGVVVFLAVRIGAETAAALLRLQDQARSAPSYSSNN